MKYLREKIREIVKPIDPKWICGKCEQEKGKYSKGEKLLKHNRHCLKRAENELVKLFLEKLFNELKESEE